MPTTDTNTGTASNQDSGVKARNLYLIRVCAPGQSLSKPVGAKRRLVPRASALRIAKRLSQALGDAFFVSIDPLRVNLTPRQVAYLDRRYSQC